MKVRRNSNVRGIIKGVFVALGKVPEHQRADRDNYVKILWDNIERGNCIYIYISSRNPFMNGLIIFFVINS